MIPSHILSLLIPVSKRFAKLPNQTSAAHCEVLQNYIPKRDYKNFGHKPKPEPLMTKLFCIFCGSVLILSLMDWRWCRMMYLSATGQIKEQEDNAKVADRVT